MTMVPSYWNTGTATEAYDTCPCCGRTCAGSVFSYTIRDATFTPASSILREAIEALRIFAFSIYGRGKPGPPPSARIDAPRTAPPPLDGLRWTARTRRLM